jgi:hypothetical protein
LTTKLTYRPILAAFLLAVYAFIATPVQWWHHHQFETKLSVVKVPGGVKSDSVSPGASRTLEADCPVCSHKYSSYSNEALTPFVLTLPVITAKHGCYLLQRLANSPAALTNKGPPVFS